MKLSKNLYTSTVPLAFALLVLHVISCYASQDASSSLSASTVTAETTQSSVSIPSGQPSSSEAKHDSTSRRELEQAAEATRAYKQALATLSMITSLPSFQTYDTSTATNVNSKSIFSSLLPNVQGQGPIGTIFRIMVRLYYYTFGSLSSSFARGGLGLGSKRREEEIRGKAIKVIDLLQHSAELGNMDALFTLSQISLFPPSQYFQTDPKRAYESLNMHASRTGNATSQSLLAFYYATGYQDVVPVDSAKAQLYYTFAANGGDRGAQMALGYRYWSGIGTLESCERANAWYGSAAEQAMAKFLSGPPGGRTLPPTATRLSDLVGGVYGPGSSVASTGVNSQKAAVKAGAARAAGETWEDVLEYYLFNADRGEIDFAYRLGKIFYQGSIYAVPGGIASGSEGVGAIPRDYKVARHYFTQIARQVWPQDPPSVMQTKDEQRPTGYAAASCAYIGRMYLRGEGVKTDYQMARLWYERGVEFGDRESHNGLGIIYRDGLGVRRDIKKALFHFNAASSQELAEAQVNIGKYYYEHGDMPLAVTYFESAMRHGSPFEAYYYLAEIHSAQASSPNMNAHMASSACTMAVSFYKLVAERGVWDDDLLRDAEGAWMSGTDQSKQLAILKWWIAAERGSEIAQNNLAYVLDQDTSILRWTRFSPTTVSNDTARLALTQWTRAAAQRNIDALVKVGDYYYHGLGVSGERESSRLEKAARYYQSAADTQLSALAMWNLGWMYENGVGVPQDFHLAKRHYDLALETNSEAYLPVFLSLMKLYARSIWHTLMGGQGGLNIWTSDEEETGFTPQKQGSSRELEDGRQKDSSLENGGKEDEHTYQDDESDGPWYFGKAREEFHRRHNRRAPRQPGDDEDPIKWARDRRNEERDRDSEFGPDDYFDGAIRGGNREDEDIDEFGETMLLVLLCLVISILLYIRTRIVERMRRDQREQQRRGDHNGQQNNGNGGVFPGPNDPARNEWAVLR